MTISLWHKISTLGYCKDCRHKNHGTDDFSDGVGLIPCKFGMACSIKEVSEIEKNKRLLYEKYNGTNFTWWCDTIEVKGISTSAVNLMENADEMPEAI